VYDKKMLWRANLYIAEEQNDWNDQHPWIVGNEWNRTYDFSKFANNQFDINNLETGNGGQVLEIPSFTHSWRGEGNTDIDDKVAYEFNGTDSPFAFAYKMDNQKVILGEKYTSGGVLKTENPNDTSSYGFKYTAPGSLHKNYAHGSNYPYGASAAQDEDGAFKLSSQSLVVNGKTYYPYVPALESAMIGSNDITPYNMDPKGAGYGAGADCLGFVDRSAAYNENPYAWASNSLSQPLWGGSRVTDGWPLLNNGDAVVITTHPDIGNPKNLEKIVPGDIFYYKNDSGDIAHILIVSDVNYGNSDSRSLSPEGITFIESTHFWGDPDTLIQLGYIKDFRTLAGADNRTGIKNKDWYALRLK